MSLQEGLLRDQQEAAKAGDKVRLGTLRLLRSAIHNAEIAKRGPLDDAGVLEVVSREAKQRRESIGEFRKGGREDLVAKEEAELAVILGYLPRQLEESEIEEAARQAIAEVGAQGPKDLGRVMSLLMGRLRGRAEGRRVNEVVSRLLRGANG